MNKTKYTGRLYRNRLDVFIWGLCLFVIGVALYEWMWPSLAGAFLIPTWLSGWILILDSFMGGEMDDCPLSKLMDRVAKFKWRWR